MASPIGSKREIKIFVLYLMENIHYPLEFTAINDIVMQTDYVAYLDFAESFNELLDGEKLPKMDALKEKRRKLAAQKKALYAEYRAAQQEMRETVAVKANIDHLLGLSDERKNKEQER